MYLRVSFVNWGIFTANYFVWDIEQFPVSRSLTLLYCRSFSELLHITFGIVFFKGSMPGNSATDWPQQPFPINAAVTRLSCLTLGSVIRLHLSFCSTWIRCVIRILHPVMNHVEVVCYYTKHELTTRDIMILPYTIQSCLPFFSLSTSHTCQVLAIALDLPAFSPSLTPSSISPSSLQNYKKSVNFYRIDQ